MNKATQKIVLLMVGLASAYLLGRYGAEHFRRNVLPEKPSAEEQTHTRSQPTDEVLISTAMPVWEPAHRAGCTTCPAGKTEPTVTEAELLSGGRRTVDDILFQLVGHRGHRDKRLVDKGFTVRPPAANGGRAMILSSGRPGVLIRRAVQWSTEAETANISIEGGVDEAVPWLGKWKAGNPIVLPSGVEIASDASWLAEMLSKWVPRSAKEWGVTDVLEQHSPSLLLSNQLLWTSTISSSPAIDETKWIVDEASGHLLQMECIQAAWGTEALSPLYGRRAIIWFDGLADSGLTRSSN